LLLAGVAADLRGAWRGKRLAIVATGALEYLPFASLPMPHAPGAATSPSGQRLIDAHEIVGIPSASVLATLRRDRAERGTPGRGIAVFADPVFEADDPRVATKAPALAMDADATRPTSTSASTEARLKAAVGGPRLSRLPFSREEASAIATLAGSQRTLEAMDFKASRAMITGSSLEQYRIVHFATHGLIDSEHAELSGLVLSLFDQQGAPQNGLLRLPDIFNMRLNADLVVLSACQTALGKEIRGEGLVGLTRGFMYAGTSRVVASLWEVNDLATAELMKKFYAGLLQRRLPPAAALRAAQRELAQDPRWSSPYFWAGFVIQGDWR
jgi:CHAT domain-containing protein